MKIITLDLDFLHISHSIAAFLIESTGGLALVECGPHSTFPHLAQALAQHGYQPSDIKHVFLSHIHFDHAGAAWAFAETGATIYVHPKGLPHLAAPEKLYNSARMIYKDDMDRLWGQMNPIPEAQLYAPAHGESITVGNLQCKAWFTPGHAVHHIAWEVSATDSASEAVLFTGDAAGVRIGHGPVLPPCPPPDINIEDWLVSIDLMRNLPVSTLYLTHFGKITDKNDHFDALSERLLEWANWIKPYFDNNTPQAEILPLFRAFVDRRLLELGAAQGELERYEAANPSFMAIAGLMRYWFKRSQSANL